MEVPEDARAAAKAGPANAAAAPIPLISSSPLAENLAREAKRLQHQRRHFRHHAVADEPDAPFLGSDDPFPAPLPFGLGRLITGHITMKAQHVHDDLFGHHRIAAGGSILPSGTLWQLWMVK